MAINSYATLRTAIADWLAREDLGDYIQDFVTLAENWLNYGSLDSSPLRCREMETTATLTMTDGVGTVPSDFLQTIRAVEDGSVRQVLQYITPQAMDTLLPSRYGGPGYFYTIVGDELQTAPLVSNDVLLTYYQALPPLAENDENWLILKAPGIYLRASLAQAAEFLKNDAEAAKQASMAQALMAGLNRSDMVGRYARAGVTIAGCTP